LPRAADILKRAIDIVGSIAGLILLSPVLFAVAVMVRSRLGRPILFRQERAGLNGRSFVMLKLRTMIESHSADGVPLSDSERLTPLGVRLRSTSLDELPELWNVLRGDMSLVGPRPLLMRYLTRYTPEQARRHDVKPGITGWAQVNGRNALGWDEKFALDTWYVDHCSFWLDLKILLLTFRRVVGGNDIAAPGEATMTEFLGDDRKITND